MRRRDDGPPPHVIVLGMAARGHILPILPLLDRMKAMGFAVTTFAAPSIEEPIIDAILKTGSDLRLYRASDTVVAPESESASSAHATTQQQKLYAHRQAIIAKEMQWLPCLLDDLRALQKQLPSPPTVLLYDTFISIGPAAGLLCGLPTVGVTPHSGPGWLAAASQQPAASSAAALTIGAGGPAAWLRRQFGLELSEHGDESGQSWHRNSTGLNLVLTCKELFSPPATDEQRRRLAGVSFACVGSMAATLTTKRPSPSEAHEPSPIVAKVRAARSAGARIIIVSLGTLVTGPYWAAGTPMNVMVSANADAASAGHTSLATRMVTGAEIAHAVWGCAFRAFGGRSDVLVVLATARDPRSALAKLPPPPANFLVASWVPMLELLPLADALVTHGGCGSVTEAVLHRCPVCVIPVFADQPANGDAAARAGFGICFRNPLATLSEEALAEAILTKLADPKDNPYRQALEAAASRMTVEGGVDKAIELIGSAVAAHKYKQQQQDVAADAELTPLRSAPVDHSSSTTTWDALSLMGIQQLLFINLERRPDRRAFIESQLPHLSLPSSHVEIIKACDGVDGPTALWWTGRPFRSVVPPASRPGVAGCYASWEAALARALQLGRFPCLVVEDDVDLLAPSALLKGAAAPLPLPGDAHLIALANGPSLAALRLGASTGAGAWLSRSTAPIRGHCHSTGAMLLPAAEGCQRLLAFLRSRPALYHVDRVMQCDYVEEAGGVVYHAIPSLYGWVESASDVEGGPRAWVRPANSVA